MSSNLVNLGFFLAKSGVSWENIGLTKPNTECIGGQAPSPVVSPNPSSNNSTSRRASPVRNTQTKRETRRPTSGAKQEAARSPIGKKSLDREGSIERRTYPNAPRSPFASVFHIRNSPRMTEAERRASTAAVTRFRMYIRESKLGKAEDAAETARDAANKAWLAALEARKAAVRAEEAAVNAEGAFKRLKAEEPERRADYDGDKTPPATPRWSGSNGGCNDDNTPTMTTPTMTTPPWEGSDSDGEDQGPDGSDSDGEDQGADGADSDGEDQGAVSAGASEHQSTVSDGSECEPPNESISMEDFPEHRTMLDSDANRIGAGFPDIVLGQPQAPSVGELRADLDEAVAELKRCKREMPGLRRKDDGCGRKLSHCRDKISKGISVDIARLRQQAYQQASDLKQGARDVQAAVRWVRAQRWSLNMVGEMPNKRTRLSHVESAGSDEDA